MRYDGQAEYTEKDVTASHGSKKNAKDAAFDTFLAT